MREIEAVNDVCLADKVSVEVSLAELAIIASVIGRTNHFEREEYIDNAGIIGIEYREHLKNLDRNDKVGRYLFRDARDILKDKGVAE